MSLVGTEHRKWNFATVVSRSLPRSWDMVISVLRGQLYRVKRLGLKKTNSYAVSPGCQS